MAGKRRFGRVRKLPSGRYQARYRGPDGLDHAVLVAVVRWHDAQVPVGRDPVIDELERCP